MSLTISPDVRERHEFAAGHIPTALNVPIMIYPDGLFLTPKEFKIRFGFEKPSDEKEVVFYCKLGRRSKYAAGLAEQGGWENMAGAGRTGLEKGERWRGVRHEVRL